MKLCEFEWKAENIWLWEHALCSQAGGAGLLWQFFFPPCTPEGHGAAAPLIWMFNYDNSSAASSIGLWGNVAQTPACYKSSRCCAALCLNLHIIHFTSTVSRIGIRIIYPVSTERMWRLILHNTWPWLASSFCLGCHYWCKPAKWSFSSSVIFVVQRETGWVQLCHIFFSNLSSFCIAPIRPCLSWVWIHFLFYFINVHLHAFPRGFCSLFCFLPACVQKANHWQHKYSILLWGSASQSLCFMNNSSWFSFLWSIVSFILYLPLRCGVC